MSNKTKFTFWLAGASVFAGGFFSAWFLQPILFPPASGRGSITREGPQDLINPLLSCEIAGEKEFYEFKPLKEKTAAVIQQNIDRGKASSVSVYFRTLNSGRWFGVSQDEKFSPASLLKVPIMIAYFKLAETHPEILAKNAVFQDGGNRNRSEYYKPSRALAAGETYTIEDLISRMITYSDNNAQNILKQNLDPNSLKDVYTDLGLTIPQSQGEIDFMSPKTYGFIFRVLYGATYLNRLYSNKALALLQKTEFKDGLAAGLPSGTTVVHKFGERSVTDARGKAQFRELHDCGIVYYPNHPYLVCIMTRGQSFDDLEDAIADISRAIFNETTAFFNNGK